LSHEYQNYKGQILGENPSGETKRIQVDENGNLLTSTSISNQVEIMGFGMVDTTPVLDPDQLTANQLGLLRGLLKQLQDGTMKTEINGSLANVKGAVVNVTTAGSRVQLPNIPCNVVTITAKRENTGYIYIGGSDVSSTVYGDDLASKESFTLQIANLNQLYIDSSVSGEGISYVAI